ncbi:MAG: hypothetical protein HYU28_11225 [Actinobacteria bacterium]|nr:hypothetical protein [Actinomycetota bacterium]
MAGVEARDFGTPDETRTPEKTTVELVRFSAGEIGRYDDGSEVDLTAGSVYRVAPGHDAWNTGDEPAVFVEFQGASHYAEG